MWTDSTLQPVFDNAPYTAPDGTQYSGTFPKSTIPGLQAVTTSLPSPPAGQVATGFVIQIISTVPTQVWQYGPAPAPSAGQVAQIISTSVNSAIARKAQSLAAKGNTAGALKLLLKLQQ